MAAGDGEKASNQFELILLLLILLLLLLLLLYLRWDFKLDTLKVIWLILSRHVYFAVPVSVFSLCVSCFYVEMHIVVASNIIICDGMLQFTYLPWSVTYVICFKLYTYRKVGGGNISFRIRCLFSWYFYNFKTSSNNFSETVFTCVCI